jgi:hypothetical protein
MRFKTAEKARIHARYIHRAGGDMLNAYQCPHCNWFHLGHQPGTRQEHRSVVLATSF